MERAICSLAGRLPLSPSSSANRAAAHVNIREGGNLRRWNGLRTASWRLQWTAWRLPGTERRAVVVRELEASLQQFGEVHTAEAIHQKDRQAGLPGVWLPDALERKYPPRRP